MHRFTALLLAVLLPLAARAATPETTGLAAAQTFPFSMAGQLTFLLGGDPYVGSGTTVQPRGVLTAGHNLYDSLLGWSTDLVFRRGHYDASNLSVRRPNRIWVLAGYQTSSDAFGGDSLRAFAHDTGGLTFTKNVANGGYLGWTTDPTLLTGNAAKIALGYGAETVKHDGERLLSVIPATAFAPVFKNFYESQGTAIEGGMSGGPVICTLPNGNPSLCGTIVSGSNAPIAGGIRIINAGVSAFILNYLADKPN